MKTIDVVDPAWNALRTFFTPSSQELTAASVLDEMQKHFPFMSQNGLPAPDRSRAHGPLSTEHGAL